MWANIQHHASVGLFFLKIALQRQLEYPLFLFSWIVGNPLVALGEVFTFYAVTRSFHSLGGWTFSELAFLYGIGLISHSLQVIFFIQTWSIQGMVIHGGFDRMILRPMNVLFQFLIQYINLIGVTNLIPGVLIFFFACHLVNFHWTIFIAIKLILVIVGGTLIRAAFYIITGSLAFWTKSSNHLVGTSQVLLLRTTQYPLSIFPLPIRMMFTYIIPFAFISYIPAIDLLGKNAQIGYPPGLTILSLIVGILFFMIAIRIFKSGLKKYESAGA